MRWMVLGALGLAGCQLLVRGLQPDCLDGAPPGEFCYFDTQPVPGVGGIRALAAGDLNNDGRADLVSLNVDGSSTLFLHNGSGFDLVAAADGRSAEGDAFPMDGAAFLSLAGENDGGTPDVYWLFLDGAQTPARVVRGTLQPGGGLLLAEFGLDRAAFGSADFSSGAQAVTGFVAGNFCAEPSCVGGDEALEVALSLREAQVPYNGAPPALTSIRACALEGCRLFAFELEGPTADQNPAFFATSNVLGRDLQGQLVEQDLGPILALGVQDLAPGDPDNQASEFFSVNTAPLPGAEGERSLSVFLNALTAETTVLPLAHDALDLAVAQVNGVGEVDLVVLHREGVEVFFPDEVDLTAPVPRAQGLLRSLSLDLGGAAPASFALGNFDGAGALDLVIAANSPQEGSLFLVSDLAGALVEGSATPRRFFFAGSSFSGVEAVPGATSRDDLFFSLENQSPFLLLATP